MLTLEKHDDGGLTLTSAVALCSHMAVVAHWANWPDEMRRWRQRYDRLREMNVARGEPAVNWPELFEAIDTANATGRAEFRVRLLEPHKDMTSA
jgi:hypothetical protein